MLTDRIIGEHVVNGNPAPRFQEFNGIDDITPHLIINMQAVNKNHIEIFGIAPKEIITVGLMGATRLGVNAKLVPHGNGVEQDIVLAANLKIITIKL